MTRKDYVLIAGVFAHFGKICDLEETIGADLAYKFADVLEEDNPRFDRHKFLVACGVK
jgi:hypothetical protein